jgi:amidase
LSFESSLIMSVFSLDTSLGNPVTKETVEKLCSKLGVTIEEKEKEDYRRLLAVFHDASEQLMAMDGKLDIINVQRGER